MKWPLIIIFVDMMEILLVAVSKAVSRKISWKRVFPERFATKFTRNQAPVPDLLFSKDFAKKDFNRSDFRLVLQNFLEQLFYGTPINDCIYKTWCSYSE